ncbi:MAG TPA: carboxypeptidase regulatory-like domain-containing protein [Acidobacteriaceae bacterium]|nr:carboxypeptidase regulatory-like domain-containing protein [Acidobacteriaceae bacterium]
MHRTMIRGVRLCVMMMALCGVTWAQTSKPGTGTVTGHVFCQDTQKPARFAQVTLLAVPPAVTAMPKLDGTDTKTIEAFRKSMNDAMSSTTFVMTETGLDGSFAAEDLAPGDYFVMASVGGYIQPHELLQAAYDAGEDLTKGVTGVPTVSVSADHSVNAEISVMRGAAIEGRVLWDDGSGVHQANVSVEPKTGEHKQLPPQFTMFLMNGEAMANTDDRGHYRISGLAPGEYTIRVMLQTNHRMVMQRGRFDQGASFGTAPLIVYAPAGFRKKDAKPVAVSAGEERTDEDITFDLGATHTVSGRVTSAEDHHGLNRGVVILTDTTEKTFTRSAGLAADGSFTVPFVPSGTYTMEVRGAADTVPEEPKKSDQAGIFTSVGFKTVRSYQKAEQQVMVAGDDLTGENIELTPAKSSENDTQTGNQ